MITLGTTVAPAARRPAALAALALLVSNGLFALGGLAGSGHRTTFASFYGISALIAVPMIYMLVVSVRGRGATLTLFGALLMGVAAIGHGIEATLIATPSLDIGTAGPAIGVIELVGLVLGMLLLSGGLWRAKIVPIWPGLLFLLVLPVNRLLPHGLAQQSARSMIVVVVSLWLAYGLFSSDRDPTEKTIA